MPVMPARPRSCLRAVCVHRAPAGDAAPDGSRPDRNDLGSTHRSRGSDSWINGPWFHGVGYRRLAGQSSMAGDVCGGAIAHGRCIATAMVMEAGPDSKARIGRIKNEVKAIFRGRKIVIDAEFKL